MMSIYLNYKNSDFNNIFFETTLQKRGRKGCISRWGQDTKRTQPTNPLNRVHRGPQRLNQQTQSLYGSFLSPLHIPYGCVAWWSCRTPNNGSMCRVYCTLLGHVQWKFLVVGGLCFFIFKGSRGRGDLGERGGRERTWEV